MSDEPEETFTVRDRRGAAREASTEFSTTVPTEVVTDDVSTLDELPADFDESENEDRSLPDVYSVIALFLGELRNLAWLRMGLLANPGTGLIERDLSQARVAIDTVAHLADQLQAVAASEERLELKSLVNDLQVNFVEQSKRSL